MKSAIATTALLLVLALGSTIAKAQPATELVRLNREIRYGTPILRPLTLTVTTKLPASRKPSRVEMIVITSHPRSIVEHINEVRRRMDGIKAQGLEVMKRSYPGVPVSIAYKYNNSRRGINHIPGPNSGFKLVKSVSNGDKWIKAYIRVTYGNNSSPIEVKASVQLTGRAKINSRGQVRLLVTAGAVQVSRLSGLTSRQAEALRRFRLRVTAEAAKATQLLNGKLFKLGSRDKQRFIDGSRQIEKKPRLPWFNSEEHMSLLLSATLGRRVVEHEPGNF